MENKEIKRKLTLLTLGVFLTFPACGNDIKVIEGEVKAISTESVTTETEDSNETNRDETFVESASTEYKGYVFVHNGVFIEIDAEAEPVIEQLGEPSSYFEAPSCAFDGIDKMYTYNSFEVDTYPLDGQDYLSAIIFKDDAIATTEGVGIGDSIDKVKEIYGDEGIDTDGMLVYEKDGMKLCFIVQDDSVVSIEYRSTILEE